jgi:hypothetical protein
VFAFNNAESPEQMYEEPTREMLEVTTVTVMEFENVPHDPFVTKAL